MNLIHWKQVLPFIIAFSEGKKVEYLDYDDNWVPCEEPGFTFGAHRYRIKPEKKRGWIAIYNGSTQDGVRALGSNIFDDMVSIKKYHPNAHSYVEVEWK